ncbi:MAG: lipoyl(octanoyl) transferase LipB [Burkholderiaceae bacterium]
MSHDITVRQFRPADYVITLREMQTFTAQRDDSTPDEIWLVEHPPVFTQGLAGKDEHVLDPGEIPVIKTERGGQVTYHGPGQVVAYLLLDIKRRHLGIRDLVCRIEQAVINHLSSQAVPAQRKAGAPGVYIAPPNVLAGSKIASLGLKVSRGRTFHGVALNVAMNLDAFDRINPCGMAGLKVTDLQTLVGPVNVAEQASRLGNSLVTTIQD